MLYNFNLRGYMEETGHNVYSLAAEIGCGAWDVQQCLIDPKLCKSPMMTQWLGRKLAGENFAQSLFDNFTSP